MFFKLLKKHYKAFKKEWDSYREVNKFAKELLLVDIKFMGRYQAWIDDVRHQAKVLYNREKSSIIKEEMEEVIKKENNNA